MHTLTMKGQKTILTILLALVAAALRADGVHFRSGGKYRLSCLERPGGCVVPGGTGATDPRCPLAYSDDAAACGRDALWTVSRGKDGTYSIRHAATGRWLTYTGERSAHQRYVALTDRDRGKASRWRVYAGRRGILVASIVKPGDLLNVRRRSQVVGTYAEKLSVATDNERFLLTDERGRTVNFLDGPVTMEAAAAAAPQPAARSATRLKFSLDSRVPVYDGRSHTYLAAIPRMGRGERFTAHVKAQGAGGGRIFVDGKAAGAGGRVTFASPVAGRRYRLALCEGADTVASAWLTFTTLPVVEVTAGALSRSSFVAGTFRYHDPDAAQPMAAMPAKLRRRGGYARLMDKPALAVKLTGADGRAANRALPGMRSDNYWILDAMAVDLARSRNRVAMDLWNDIRGRAMAASGAAGPAGVRGRLVELVMDGRYAGVYNLSERVDRKQLGLARPGNDGVRGCLYKGTNWTSWTLMGWDAAAGRLAGGALPAAHDESELWQAWEMKYPKPTVQRPGDWRPLTEAARMVASAGRDVFAREAGRRFDLAAVRDYWLFLELVFAVDNTGKNMFWYAVDTRRDARLRPVPWDLDATFGRDWAGGRLAGSAAADYRDYLRKRGGTNALFERLMGEDPDGWNAALARRYRELRRTEFSPERLCRRFESYLSQLEESGAARRERDRWNGRNGVRVDIKAEGAMVREWIVQRVAALDRKYGYR